MAGSRVGRPGQAAVGPARAPRCTGSGCLMVPAEAGKRPGPHHRRLDNAFTRRAGIEVPIIGGPMYPCSNPELVAAVSEAGGIGIVQPISLTYVHGHDFREGLRLIRRLTAKPIGMNALIEKSSRRYHERMVRWVELALEDGVRFFITSMGKPAWVVRRVHAVGGVVYHDVTELKWATKSLDEGVDGLIAVNNRAGGHAGRRSAERLFADLSHLKVPVICAGGVGNEAEFVRMLSLGYAGVQMGTRFIATDECRASQPYKDAIVRATERDIVLSERVSGTPVSLIRTPSVDRQGLRPGPAMRWMLGGKRTKYVARTLLLLRSLRQLKAAVLDESGSRDFWQGGKSVAGVHSVEPAGDIVRRFAAAARL
ncbi:MAG: nitronate monooxygenase [Gammaproteobacteria bacterium]|nr:nitronate monooxygenase [Gammaproteobacteria bacterium]